MHPKDERRNDSRRPVLRGALTGPRLEARLLNLSRSGAAVETASSLAIGNRYRVTIWRGRNSELAEAVVAWCRLVATRPLAHGEVAPIFRAGLRFVSRLAAG